MVAWTVIAVVASVLSWATSSQLCAPPAGPWDTWPSAQGSHSNSCPFTDPSSGPLFSAFRQRRFLMDTLASKITSGTTMQGSLATPSIDSPPYQNGTPMPMAISVGLEVVRVSGINQKEQNFKMHFLLQMTWLDCRTMHNCTSVLVQDYSPEYNKFWRPAHRLNVVDTSKTDHTLHGSLYVRPDGFITWAMERTQTLHCSFAFGDMPFDEHECGFDLVSPSLPASSAMWVVDAVRGNKLSNLEWEITQVKDWKFTVLNVTTGARAVSTSQLRVRFQIKRKPSHLFKTVVIPVLWIYFVSWIGLSINPKAVPARAAMGVIPVLIMINKQSALAAAMPPISGTTRLGIFMQVSTAFVILHLCEFGALDLVLRTQGQKASDSDAEAPTGTTSATVVGRLSYQVANKVVSRSTSWDAYLRLISAFLYTLFCLLVFLV